MDQIVGQVLDNGAGAASLPCNLCGSVHQRHLFTRDGFRLVRCTDCGLAYIANPPDDSSIESIYSAEANYHSTLLDPTSRDFATMQGVARRHLKVLGKTQAPAPGLNLLDIGCSTGLFLNEARQAGYAVSGVELSPQSSAFARDHFGLDVHTGLLSGAGFAAESFDIITLFDVVEHVPDPLALLGEIRALLKPGGLLLQSTPNIDGLFPRVSYPLANLLDYWPHPEPPGHLFQFSVRTLKELTVKAGYETGRVDHTCIGLDYTFGSPKSWKVSPKMVPYAMLFAPFAVVGPWIGMGDWFYLAARKPLC